MHQPSSQGTPVEPVTAAVRVSTDEVPSGRRLAFWADQVCAQLLRVQVDTVGSLGEFNGSIERAPLQDLDVCRVRSGAQSVRRTQSMADEGSCETILFNIQREGISQVSQAGRTAWLHPGDFTLISSARPCGLDFQASFEHTVLRVPAAELRGLLGRTELPFAQVMSGSGLPGRLLTQLADGVIAATPARSGDVETPDPQVSGHVRHALLHTLAALVVPHLPPASEPERRRGRNRLSAYHLARIHAVIEAHLGDPALDVEHIASFTRLSPSHIHRLFETEPATVAATIRRRRLQCCREQLADPAHAHRSISEIAFQCGFNQAAHFSRVFRQAFGMTPTEWRVRR